MDKKAIDLFKDLLDEAIDCSQIPKFDYYSNMTTAHAERCIISLLTEGKLYKYNGRLIIKKFNRLCFIFINKLMERVNVGTFGSERPIDEEEKAIETVRVLLPFSPKHILNNGLKSGQMKRMTDYFTFNTVVNSLTF